MTNTGVHLTQLITESVEASIHMLKLCHDVLESHTAHRRRGADVDGVEGVGGAADPDHLDRNCASLHLMVVVSIAPITEKWLDKGKGTKKWCKILVIAEGKMSLSWVTESLYISMTKRMK